MDALDRQRALVEAGIALVSELELEEILHKLVETAARLAGARYAALGVIGRDGETLDRFVTHGMDEAEQRAIGPPPRGRGVLGVLIRDARPLRLRSPPIPAPSAFRRAIRRCLVPQSAVLLRGTAYGNLYLTGEGGGTAFTDGGRR
jgi:GAF domain-containing protein